MNHLASVGMGRTRGRPKEIEATELLSTLDRIRVMGIARGIAVTVGVLLGFGYMVALLSVLGVI